MKYLLLLTLIILQISCSNNQEKNSSTLSDSTTSLSSNTKNDKTLIWTDRLNREKYPLPDSVGGKPIAFYIENPNVASIAKLFYLGKFRPSDNDSTAHLLSLVLTEDSTIRPFYRWCLDFTISLSDGALGEYPGVPALQYAINFPAEFFNYMDKETSGKRYKEWTEIIAYSGLNANDYTVNKDSDIEVRIISQMENNCKNCTTLLTNRIEKFAKDILNFKKLQD